MTDLTELHRRATRLARMDQTERRVYESLERIGRADQVVDILTKQTRYMHYSLPDGRTLIFDISGCDMAATTPNADNTLTVIKDGEEIRLESM